MLFFSCCFRSGGESFAVTTGLASGLARISISGNGPVQGRAGSALQSLEASGSLGLPHAGGAGAPDAGAGQVLAVPAAPPQDLAGPGRLEGALSRGHES